MPGAGARHAGALRRAQARLARNRDRSPRATRRGEYLLRRLVSCRRCGPGRARQQQRPRRVLPCLPRTGDRRRHHAAAQAHSVATRRPRCRGLGRCARCSPTRRSRRGGAPRSPGGSATRPAGARQHELRQRRATLERQRQRLIDAYAAGRSPWRGCRRACGRWKRASRHGTGRAAARASEEHEPRSPAGPQLEAFRATIARAGPGSFARRRELVELLDRPRPRRPGRGGNRHLIPFGGAAHRKVALQSGHQNRGL